MFWPFVMGAAAVLTIAGAVVGRGAWRVPALALAGYVATRIAVENIPATTAWDEITVCTIWLSIAAFMMYREAWVPGALYAMSAMTYPIFVVFGLHIGWLALPNIIAEVFAILALMFIGGGIGHIYRARAFGNHDRSGNRVDIAAMGVAPNTRGDKEGRLNG